MIGMEGIHEPIIEYPCSSLTKLLSYSTVSVCPYYLGGLESDGDDSFAYDIHGEFMGAVDH